MDLLLDTHTCVWWATDPELLRVDVRAAIAAPENAVWMSVASAWELSIKVRTGKLQLDVERLCRGLATDGIGVLGIGLDDAIGAGALDWSHRDPFDRMLAAQARRSRLTLATRDSALLGFLGGDAIEA